jgi:hypothetical protein
VIADCGNHGTKFFHRNDDPITNEWASKLIANDVIYKASLSSSAPGALNTSLSEHEEASCSPRMFLGLKNGGPWNKYIAEAIIIQSGRLWRPETLGENSPLATSMPATPGTEVQAEDVGARMWSSSAGQDALPGHDIPRR